MNSKMGELVMALFLLLFSLTTISASFLYAAETRIVPLSVGGGTFILLLAVIANKIRPIVFLQKLDIDLTKRYKQEDLKILTAGKVELKQLLHMVLWIVFFFLLIFFFGFLVSIPLYTVGFLKVQGKMSWLRALISGVILEAVVFLLFEVAMEFSLYRGWLFGEVIPPF